MFTILKRCNFIYIIWENTYQLDNSQMKIFLSEFDCLARWKTDWPESPQSRTAGELRLSWWPDFLPNSHQPLLQPANVNPSTALRTHEFIAKAPGIVPFRLGSKSHMNILAGENCNPLHTDSLPFHNHRIITTSFFTYQLSSWCHPQDFWMTYTITRSLYVTALSETVMKLYDWFFSSFRMLFQLGRLNK